MDRREALELIAWMMGGALSASTVAGVLSGCSAGERGVPFVARTLTGPRLEVVATVAEHIIPATDTPGARGARVHAFIDNMLTDYYGSDETQRFLDGLEDLQSRASAAYQDRFLALASKDQVALLKALEDEAVPFFDTIKSLTLTGYYTSEVGATQELHLAPYGSYQADIPYSQIGRTWA